AGVPHRRAGGRGEEGLTTLEWLLVVAAVAGLAALAVVLVRDVADDTAETLRTVNRRQLAFDLATTELTERWAAETPDSRKEAERINRDRAGDCRELAIIYADVPARLFVKSGKYDEGPPRGWSVLPICAFF
ncbi:MAG: hypothetical protein OXE75_01165, partial [bacterium]|nr:hypothetical protein [bacterium]